jgi:hypothetical protein
MGKNRVATMLCLSTLLAGCGGINVWPFGESRSTEASRKPSNATEYQCDGGKAIYVRNLDGGAVWLIAPDREIRLDKLPGAKGTVYGVGKVRLELTEQSATLLDPPAQFLGCKRAEAK